MPASRAGAWDGKAGTEEGEQGTPSSIQGVCSVGVPAFSLTSFVPASCPPALLDWASTSMAVLVEMVPQVASRVRSPAEPMTRDWLSVSGSTKWKRLAPGPAAPGWPWAPWGPCGPTAPAGPDGPTGPRLTFFFFFAVTA